ncbi:MAG: IPTL-CTERM sorting domain-containing protein [Betaproteobacteria bacterium]
MLVSTGLDGGPRRLEMEVLHPYAAPKLILLAPALFWAVTGFAQTAGTAGKPAPLDAAAPTASTLPSIQILSRQTTLAGTCGGAAFNLNTDIRVDTQSSAEVRLSAPGFPTLAQFTDETGANVGPFVGNFPAFTIPAFGGGLAPNTPIRVTVNTYTGRALSGKLSYTSTIQFDCTTGTILNLVGNVPGDPVGIPALGHAALVAMALLLASAGALALRRRTRARVRTRPAARRA